VIQSWGRLFRISLAPSAAADVVAGLVFFHAGGWPSAARAWWLVPAALGIYHGNLALNDWRDSAHDERSGRERVLVRGDISRRAALAAAASAITLGLVAAALAHPWCTLWMGALASCAVVYNLVGRGPWSGPALLAACRALNLSVGLCFALASGALEPRAALTPAVLGAPLAYGAYVFLVSRLGRMEDGEDAAPLARRPSTLLLAIALALCALPLAWTLIHGRAGVPALVLAVLGAFGLVRTAWNTKSWTRPLVERAMGACLRRLLIFSACVALLHQAWSAAVPWIAAAAILCGYPIAHALRRAFPPS
jgi:4-hydroxybenzoate polyprenyltransferase